MEKSRTDSGNLEITVDEDTVVRLVRFGGYSPGVVLRQEMGETTDYVYLSLEEFRQVAAIIEEESGA